MLTNRNFLFSADLVGYAREHLRDFLGLDVTALYFNGAQGDIAPLIFNEEDRFDACDQLGLSLAKTVREIWDRIETQEDLEIQTQREFYSFQPQPTPFGLSCPSRGIL